MPENRGTFGTTTGTKRRGSYKLSENDSAPSSLPQEVMVSAYPEVGSGGSMADDSLAFSDRLSNNRASGVRRQNANTPY